MFRPGVSVPNTGSKIFRMLDKWIAIRVQIRWNTPHAFLPQPAPLIDEIPGDARMLRSDRIDQRLGGPGDCEQGSGRNVADGRARIRGRPRLAYASGAVGHV